MNYQYPKRYEKKIVEQMENEQKEEEKFNTNIWYEKIRRVKSEQKYLRACNFAVEECLDCITCLLASHSFNWITWFYSILYFDAEFVFYHMEMCNLLFTNMKNECDLKYPCASVIITFSQNCVTVDQIIICVQIVIKVH